MLSGDFSVHFGICACRTNVQCHTCPHMREREEKEEEGEGEEEKESEEEE